MSGPDDDSPSAPTGLALASPVGRWVVAITVAGSGMAFVDSTVVNVALPEIGEDLGAPTGVLQWVVTGYLVTLASLILVSGSLSDRYGRRRVFVIGAACFTGASALCAAAPTSGLLIAARVAQGVGAALLTPGSLAAIQATIRPDDRGRAIGMWSGLTGIASAVGPAIGGVLIAAVSWRLIFLVNVPVGAFVVLAALRHLPESRRTGEAGRVDGRGAALAVLALALATLSLTAPALGTAARVAAGLVAAVLAVVFVVVERRSPDPMVPMGLFRVRLFSAANVVTIFVYAANGGFFFLFASYLQIVHGYSPLLAGAAATPVTVLMLLLSPTAGGLSKRTGPRLPLVVGPVGIAAGLGLLARTGAGSDYLTGMLPGLVVFGLGLVALVAPLTASVLDAAGEDHAGVGSSVNNAVARVGTLAAVAVLPAVAGLTGDRFYDPVLMADGFGTAMWCCAGLALVGAAVAALFVPAGRPEPSPAGPPERECFSCPVSAPDAGVEAALGAGRR